jgi:hypothetical protein
MHGLWVYLPLCEGGEMNLEDIKEMWARGTRAPEEYLTHEEERLLYNQIPNLIKMVEEAREVAGNNAMGVVLALTERDELRTENRLLLKELTKVGMPTLVAEWTKTFAPLTAAEVERVKALETLKTACESYFSEECGINAYGTDKFCSKCAQQEPCKALAALEEKDNG